MVSRIDLVLINPQKVFNTIDHRVLDEVNYMVLVSLVTISKSNNVISICQIRNSRFWRISFRSYHVVARVNTWPRAIFHRLMLCQTFANIIFFFKLMLHALFFNIVSTKSKKSNIEILQNIY